MTRRPYIREGSRLFDLFVDISALLEDKRSPVKKSIMFESVDINGEHTQRPILAASARSLCHELGIRTDIEVAGRDDFYVSARDVLSIAARLSLNGVCENINRTPGYFTCSSCRRVIPTEASYCPRCGKKVVGSLWLHSKDVELC